MNVDELCFDLLCPREVIQKAIRYWVDCGVLICCSVSPIQYRRIRYFGEEGLRIDDEKGDKLTILGKLKAYERFIIDILNTCTDFTIHDLQKRLTVFLRGLNKCNCMKTYANL